MAKCGVFEYEIIKHQNDKRVLKKYIYTFLVEFAYNNTLEYLQKVKLYLQNTKAVHLIEEENGKYYIYVRKNKRELTKGVNII